MQQEYFLRATHRWNVKTGATRSGKTYMDYFVIPKRIMKCSGNGLIVLLGNTKGTLERNILTPMREIWGAELVGNISSNNTVMLFGQRCHALGAEKISQVSKLQGAGIEYCYGDEITTWSEDVFTMLKSRLDKPHSCFDGTCNPTYPSHWFKKFLDSGADIYHQHYTIDDNPFLTPEFVAALKQEYAGTIYYDRFILGNWVKAEGLIYPMFDAMRHVVPTIQRDYTRYFVAMDYGILNPTAMLLIGECGGKWYVVNEYYHSGRETNEQKTDDEYYTALCSFCGGLPIDRVIIDPSAASFITLIKRKGRFRVLPAKNDVIPGIADTATVLQRGDLLINDCCKRTIAEFGLYTWDDKSETDRVIKADDHAMDALRYFVYTQHIAKGKEHPYNSPFGR